MIIDADLSSLEYKVAAQLSGDPVMIAEICNGLDPHGSNATLFFGDIKYRQEAKVFTFRINIQCPFRWKHLSKIWLIQGNSL